MYFDCGFSYLDILFCFIFIIIKYRKNRYVVFTSKRMEVSE